MEITINIPQNTYRVPTEVRPDVVQLICDSFLCGNCDRIFHPFSASLYHKATHFVETKEGKGVGFVNPSNYQGRVECVRFNGAEMQAAFKALIGAGYHMFRSRTYGTWFGYIAHQKPYHDGDSEVFEFSEFID